MQPTQKELSQAVKATTLRACTDRAFREKALKEPVAAINEASGLDLPLNTPVAFSETFEELVFVLPPAGSDPNEITDEEMLGSVSGGISPVVWGTLLIAGTIVGTIQLTKD